MSIMSGEMRDWLVSGRIGNEQSGSKGHEVKLKEKK